MRRALALVVLVSVSCTPKKGRWRPGPGDDLPRPERTVLVPRPEEEARAAAGFRVVFAVDPASRLVELGLRVRTGHVDDPPGKEGLAHLVEHLVFELRPGGPATPSLGERLQAVASDVNATTDLEATHFVASAPRDLAPRVAEVLADIPRHATCEHIDPRVFAREREVVRNELHLRGDAASRTLIDALTVAAYTSDHPYRRLAHTSASLDAITWQDVCDFLNAHYRPSEMFLVLGGGVLSTRLPPLLAPFDAIRVDEPSPATTVVDLAAVRARLRVEADVDEDLVMLVWPLPGRYSPDGIAGRTIAAWLGGALARAERKGLLGENGVVVLGGPRAPYLVAIVERGDDPADTLMKTVVDVATHLWDDVDGDSAFMVRQAAVRAVFGELVPESGRTRLLADYTQFDADGSLSSDVSRLEGMRRDDLEALTRRLITADRASVVEVVARDGLSGKAPELRNAFPEPPASTAAPAAASDEAYQAKIEVTSFKLGNGLEVVLAPTSFSPMVQARLVVPGGLTDAANPAVPLYAGLALAPPDDGAGSYGAAGLLLFSPLADYDVTVDAFTTTFEVSALGGWQDVVVWGLARLVRAGTYDKGDVARLVARGRETLPAATDAAASRRRRIARAATELRYGPAHPVSRLPLVDADHLDAIDVARLTEWHRARHVPRGARLVVTGHFSASLLKKHITEAFAGWEGGGRRSVPWATPSNRPRRLAVVDADETHVTFAVRIPTKAEGPDGHATALVAAELLDARVRSVRERLGAAYTIHAHVERSLSPAVVVTGQVNGAFATEGFTLVAAAVADVRGGAFSDEELERARLRASRNLRGRLAVADPTHVTWRVLGQDTEYGASVVDALEGLTGDTGRKAVSTAVAHAEHVVLTGPPTALAAGAAALGGAPDVTIE